MKCPKCQQSLRCIRCGATAPNDNAISPGGHLLTHSIGEELRKRSMCVEVSKGVMRKVLLFSDVEEILAMMPHSPAARS